MPIIRMIVVVIWPRIGLNLTPTGAVIGPFMPMVVIMETVPSQLGRALSMMAVVVTRHTMVVVRLVVIAAHRAPSGQIR
ncbi:MAG: hypothetical protein ACR2FO_01125 [Actinomycetota bacterium]